MAYQYFISHISYHVAQLYQNTYTVRHLHIPLYIYCLLTCKMGL